MYQPNRKNENLLIPIIADNAADTTERSVIYHRSFALSLIRPSLKPHSGIDNTAQIGHIPFSHISPVASCAPMVIGDDPRGKAGLSAHEIESVRRERDALALRIAESEQTIERSKELLKRLDQILAAYGG